SLGTFNSHEYESVFFKEIHLDQITGDLVFVSSSDSLIKISDATVRGNRIISGGAVGDDMSSKIAEFVLVYAGGRDALKLEELVEGIYPQNPRMPLLAGVYRGQCEGRENLLQLETSRWTQ